MQLITSMITSNEIKQTISNQINVNRDSGKKNKLLQIIKDERKKKKQKFFIMTRMARLRNKMQEMVR